MPRSDETLETELRELSRRFEQITEVPEQPRPLLSVIEHSLGKRRKTEVYVNRMLAYFLDPAEPHGMGAQFLRAVLEGLEDVCGFDEDLYDLEDVRVDDQVQVGSGLVDLVVQAPREWFLMIELKFHAAESGTVAYREAEGVGDATKDEYESGRYYLYLHHRDEPEASEPDFANGTWRRFVEDVIRPFHAEHAPRLPQRTATQLREFIDDIEDITGMSDQQRQENKKVELYLDHYDAIREVTETFEDRWAIFASGQWSEMLWDRLESGGRDPSGWHTATSGNDWGILFKEGWYTHTETGEPLSSRAQNSNDARIILHHRLDRDREDTIRDRALALKFRNCGSNDRPFREAFNERFDDRRDDIKRLLPSPARLVGQKRNKIVATYDIETETAEDFFEAYVDALGRAFVDLAVDNEPFVELMDDLFARAFEDTYGRSPAFRG